MFKKHTVLLSKRMITLILFLATNLSFSGSNFNIVEAPGFFWPTSVYVGQTVHAFYTITNQTHSTRANFTPKGLPPTVTQNVGNTNNCPCPITLAPSESCTLQLDITGETRSNFALCNGSNCSMAAVPLYVSQANTTAPHYAYVTNSEAVYQCGLNADGSFDTCTLTPASGNPASQPQSITFATVNHTEYAYVSDSNDSILSQCLVNPNGTFGPCIIVPFSGSPVTTTFATFNGTQYAYVAHNGQITHCRLNADGTFNACHATPSSDAPSWVPYSTSFAMINGTQYAYVAESTFFGGAVYQCRLNADGTFNACNPTPTSGAPTWIPRSIAFATINGTQYAYVGDVGGVVYQCRLNSNGTFNACNPTPSVNGPTWQPISIAFETTGGTNHAYVADKTDGNGNIYQCSLNQDGTFNTCNPTPSTGAPWEAGSSPKWIAYNW